MYLSDVAIILCRPSEPGNVGAVCRAMKNMGLARLRLVAPAWDASFSGPWEETLLARTVHAEQVWEEAEIFDTLEAAMADLSLTIGTTRRRGRRRKAVTLTPEECAAFLQTHPGPAALVFGNERTGLGAEELNLCSMASHIPADDAFPSLNLSHAVQIYAYQLFRALAPGPAPPAGSWTPLNRLQLDGLVESVTATLASLGFYQKKGREEQERFLRDVFARAGLTLDEGRYLRNIFVKAANLAKKRKEG
ncbi:MAG: TrmJ/YjtD family RNA methyltransferase [Treponema sp.]|jgi:tRNA/rRNA methyltransferase/tRNA (cytidine32/uridine32-2'-O)-methyltransferase|nr:TrmJ/YjtD family RNA methyltransferase [Treponema sp.]